ncbi:MAG: hypothetical protein GW949_10085 [Spirochaetales bacterium]|nr:hypothetical protein [Spirochaetales bacterium]
MKKRIVLIGLILLLTAGGTGLFAKSAIGVSAGLPIGPGLAGSNVMLSLKIDSFPLLLGLGAQLGDSANIGITADYWITNPNLTGILNWYLGVGGYLGIGIDSDVQVDLGFRIPVGLNIFILDRALELFLEIAPTISAAFEDPVRFPVIGAQGALGFRVWF